jgi:hypothetical protein
LTGLAAVVVIGVSAYGLSPYLAFNSLRNAAKTGNRDRLEELVDFPAVRENLKSQITAGLLKSLSADPGMRDNPFATVGALLAPAITDRMVDNVVTPDGIALVLSKGTVTKPGREPRSEDPPATGASKLEAALSYRTIDRFHADLRPHDQPDTTLALTLERRGLFGWKLVRIDIPQSLFGAPSSLPVSAAVMQGAARSAQTEDAAAGSGYCRAVALVRVPYYMEGPDYHALDPGEIYDYITQYVVDKKTGVASFCSHGGGCYPQFISADGKKVEALRLQNCRIGGKSFEDNDETIYALYLDRSKNSVTELQYSDLRDTLANMGLCNACADNAAQHYLHRPTSQCALLVRSALEGDPESKAKLANFPDYCDWQH